MAALSEWLLSFRPQPERMTAEDYEALPEDVSKTIEIVGGYVVHCESPTRDHQRAVYRLQTLIERHAKSAMERGHDCIEFDFDVDLRFHDIPLTIRRPDVVLYRCLDRENKERLRAEHALLVVEVVSPGSELQDTADKHAEYARAGIPHYWIARLDATGVSVIEQYQLDQATGWLQAHRDADEARGRRAARGSGTDSDHRGLGCAGVLRRRQPEAAPAPSRTPPGVRWRTGGGCRGRPCPCRASALRGPGGRARA